MSTDLVKLLVPDNTRESLAVETGAAGQHRELVSVLTCASPEDAADIAAVRDFAHDKLAELEERRTSITKPLNDAKRAVDALFAPVKAPWQALKDDCTDKLNAYETAKLALEAAAKEAAKALSAAGNVDAAAIVLEDARVTPAEGYKKSYKWCAVLDDVNAVDRAWLRVDWDRIEQYCRAYKDSEEIPPLAGLTFQRKAVTGVKR